LCATIDRILRTARTLPSHFFLDEAELAQEPDLETCLVDQCLLLLLSYALDTDAREQLVSYGVWLSAAHQSLGKLSALSVI
jgi:hypothetical protein